MIQYLFNIILILPGTGEKMGIVKNFIHSIKLKEGLKFDWQVAEFINVEPAKLANWKSRESLPTSYQKWYCDRYDIEIKDFNKEIKLTNTTIELEGDNMDAKYVIELQKDKIDIQGQEIEVLKDALKEKQAEKTHWDMLQFDFKVKVKLIRKGFKIGRTIVDVDNMIILSDRTGFSVDELKEYYQLGKKYSQMDDHPINNIIDKESIKVLQEHTKSMPYIFESLKNMVGNHYIPVPVTYITKSGKGLVHTITYNKINWIDLTVDSKVQFLET